MPAPRRRATIRLPRASAPDLSKSIELETRVARVEADLEHIRRMMETVTVRVVALQAQLDHVIALARG